MKLDKEHFSIETDRLLLVPMSLSYAEEIFRVFDDAITQYMYPSTPKTIADTESFIEKSINEFNNGKELIVAILKRDTREYLGNSGIHAMHTRTPEFGIWIKKEAHGNGYGREAVLGLKKWADAHLSYDYITYPVVEENVASRKLVEALGGKEVLRYPKANQAGVVRNMVEYRLYPQNNETT